MHAIEVDRPDWMELIDGKVIRNPVYLTRAGIDNSYLRHVLANGQEKAELCHGVDLKVALGPPHTVDVADFAGQVKDEINTAPTVHVLARVADIGIDDTHAIAYGFNVVEIRPASFDRGVDDGDLRAEVHEAYDEVASNEPESTRY
jgi:hypothetical protein